MRTATWGDPGQPGFAGQAHATFAPNAESAQLSLNGLSIGALQNRKALLSDLDRLQRATDQSGALEELAKHYESAFGVLTSSHVMNALDVEQEPPEVLERYGRGAPENAGYGDAGPLRNEYLLAARRLVEAGARVVTLAYGR